MGALLESVICPSRGSFRLAKAKADKSGGKEVNILRRGSFGVYQTPGRPTWEAGSLGEENKEPGFALPSHHELPPTLPRAKVKKHPSERGSLFGFLRGPKVHVSLP